VKRKIFEWGGVAASVVLIVFGIASIGIGIAGVNEVRDNLAKENIVGTPDSSIPGQKVDTGSEAKAFASVMRKHTLEITGGQTYAEMGRFLDAQGNPTSDESKAAKDPNTGKPVENGLRNVWVTETALTTALNVSFFAERVAFFSIAMGVALLLTGIGFLVLMLSGVLRTAQQPQVQPATATS
jgi:F0F1-type ATP synthase membrane subunit c/vacuolar-type H+-ATPase subunit K